MPANTSLDTVVFCLTSLYAVVMLLVWELWSGMT